MSNSSKMASLSSSVTLGETLLRQSPRSWEPHSYQKTAIKWLLEHGSAALLLDPGLGKTSITLAALKVLKKSKVVKKALIVAPLRPCYAVWSMDGEIGKWEDFNHFKVKLLHGPHKGKDLEGHDLYVINPDGLTWLVKSGTLEKLLQDGLDTLVIDELSKFKHTKTKRFKTLKPFLHRFRRRWGLTGSPVANGLLDLFGQMYVLDLGNALGTFITHYRFNYFLPTGYGGYTWVLKPGAKERIYEAIAPIALSMRAEDHLDLPEMVEQDIVVDLPDSVREAYEALERDLITRMGDNVVTAANVAVASMKCRQVASGGIYVKDKNWKVDERGIPIDDFVVKRETLQLHEAKSEALLDLVEELQGSPLLVAYEFQHDLDRIKKVLGDIPSIHGKVNAQLSVAIAEDWNAGRIPVLAGHPQAMGHGLNLQGAGHHVCWYSLTWDFEQYDQLIRRVWRQGNQASRVIVHRILAKRTVDFAVAKALKAKRRGQDALFDALKEYSMDLLIDQE